jgi:dolichyl-phosphate beta-glucosyltransferase
VVTSIQSIVLVTPVWNDSDRLEVFGLLLAEAFADASMPIRWIIADDGSDEVDRVRYTVLLRRFQAIYPNVELMRFSPRSRKGGAVYQAWNLCPQADFLAFVDADGAVSPVSVLSLLSRAVEAGGACGVVGVRARDGRLTVRRRLLRALAYYVLRYLVRTIVGLECADSQCGAKAFPAGKYREVSAKLFEKGFVFDVELLLALKEAGLEIHEVELAWTEIPGSRVKLLRDSRQMLAGLFRIRHRFKVGAYRIT